MNKLSKILLLATLTVLLVSALVFSANATTYTIDSAADFKTYLYDSSLWGGNHTYNITIDSIALTGTQTPIGNNSTPFKGTINGDADGDGIACTISGINVSTSTAYTGFFGAAANSTFNDLILKGSVKSTYKGGASEYNGIVGGLLGRSRGNLTVSNVDSHLTVTSSGSAVGGIVGQVCMNTSGCAIRIEASTNQGAITGFKHVGGIVGRVGGADTTHSLKGTVTIHNCKNTAAITGTEAAVGGILGYFDYRNTTDLATLNVTYCSNIGAIKGSNHVGGIMGLHLATTQKYNAALKMKVLHNRGTIDSTASSSYRGAIVGCIYVPILDATTNAPKNMFTLEDWQHVGLDTEEGLVGIIGKPGDGQNAAEITISRAYNMVGTQILRSKTTISGTVAFNSNNVTLNVCRNVNSSESAMTSLDSASDLWTTNTATGVVTLAAYTHASHTYSSSSCYCTFCGKEGTHAYSDYVWKYDSDAKMYHITCSCGKVYTEQISTPVVYVGTGGSDSKDGLSRNNRVLTLKEAVSRLVNTGGTVAICGQLSIDSDIFLPTWKNTITFTADNSSGNSSFNSSGYVQAGFLIKALDVQLQLNGKAIFDDILFKANDSSNYRIIISANWYNLEMKHIRAVNNATCYLIAGTYGETAASTNLTATKSTSIKVDGPSLTDGFANSVGYFYERIVLGSSPLEEVTIKNKTVTLTVQDGYKTASATERTEPALIYFLYAMSTSDRIQEVYTDNCTSNIYFNDNSMVHAFSTGSRNVGDAGTETFENPDGTTETVTFTDGNAHLDKLNVYFNDNSNITDGLRTDKKALNKPDATSSDKIFENLGRFYVRNTKNTVIKISDEDGIDEYTGEGTRTVPLYHNMFFYRNGSFDSSSITATVNAEYGRHGFLPNFGDKNIYENGPAHDANTYAYTLTQSIDAECVWDEGVITTAPTPSKAGVMTYTCTICGRTKTASVYHEHTYVVKEDGTYYCYDFAGNKAWTECALTSPTTPVVIAAVPNSTMYDTVSVDVTITATTAIASSVFKVDAPDGFVLKSAEVKLSDLETGSGFTATASNTLPCTVVLVRNPVADATVEKTVVLTLTFDVSDVEDSENARIIKVYDAESYNSSEAAITTTAVSADVIVNRCYHTANTNFTWEYSVEDGYHIHCSICNEIVEAKEVKVSIGLGVTLGSEYVLEYLAQVDSAVSNSWFVFEKTDANGVVTAVVVEPDTEGTTNRYAVPGIAAKNMNDKISATYYFVKDNVFYKAPTRTYNLITYYNFAIRDLTALTRGQQLIDLLNAMFNYGSAAQVYFEYNIADGDSAYAGLVNKHIDDAAVVDYTVTDVEIVNSSSVGTLEATHLYNVDSQFASLNQHIGMSIVFAGANGNATFDTENLVFKAEYTDINGVEKTFEVGKDLLRVVESDGVEYLYVDIINIAAKDLRCEFTGALYIDDTQVSPTVTTSFECYAAQIIATDNSELEASGISNPTALKAVCKATLAYSDAAAAYLVFGTADEIK